MFSTNVDQLLLIAPGVVDDALATIVVNKLLGRAQVCGVELKNSSKRDFEALEKQFKILPFDASAAADYPVPFLGRCKKVICYEDTCFIKLWRRS
jgi:hypothetical protein